MSAFFRDCAWRRSFAISIFANPQAYREKSERQGQDLAHSGVPPECVTVAVALYVESCLPFLLSDESGEVAWVTAFARWASIYQFFLLSGYAQHSAVEQRLLEERISQAERRSQDFSVHLGEAYEKERRRLAQDLHDEIGHDLIVLKLYTEVIALDLKKGEVGQLRAETEGIGRLDPTRPEERHVISPLTWGRRSGTNKALCRRSESILAPVRQANRYQRPA